MLVKEYIQIIKGEFPYLFSQYGFEFTHSEQEKKYRYKAGIESKIYNMKLMFSRQQGGGVFYLGPQSASFHVEYPYPKELGIPYEWVTMDHLLIYLTRQRFNWDVVSQYEGEDRIRPVMRLLSEKFESFCPKAFEMFSSKEAMETWKFDYEKVLDQILKNKS